MGLGIQTLKQISPEVLASSEALDVAPRPPPPTLFPNYCDGRVMFASCFLVCLQWLNLKTSSVSLAVCLLFLHSSLLVSSLCSLLFSGGLDYKSQADSSYLSRCSRDAHLSPLSSKATHRLFLDLDLGVQEASKISMPKTESINPAPSHLSWSEYG